MAGGNLMVSDLPLPMVAIGPPSTTPTTQTVILPIFSPHKALASPGFMAALLEAVPVKEVSLASGCELIV
ncbi:hypothetical protein L208DRAFT_1471535 [Tricholoma matsutake]|nr:hypothetical protein L208DRAFT_1471535 [Tricholoma matsutake 945]